MAWRSPAETREKCPVAWSEHYGGYWFVTGLDEASAFQKRPDIFSSARELGNPDSVYKGITIPAVNTDYVGGFIEMDPPRAARVPTGPQSPPVAGRRHEMGSAGA